MIKNKSFTDSMIKSMCSCQSKLEESKNGNQFRLYIAIIPLKKGKN